MFLNVIASPRPSIESQSGQTMAEYSLVLTIITLGSLGAYALLSGSIITAVERAAGMVG